MKITITRALAELKTLRARYEKEVASSKLIGVQYGTKMKAPYSSYSTESFESQAISMNQSICDIGKRIIEIKTKIDISNFETRIKIGDQEMSVLEAINLKSLIGLKKTRLENLKLQLRNARNTYDDALTETSLKIEKQVQDQISAGTKDLDLEKKIRENLESTYKVSLIDPINLEATIEALDNEITKFEGEVDFVLSESNSTTYIEVSD